MARSNASARLASAALSICFVSCRNSDHRPRDQERYQLNFANDVVAWTNRSAHPVSKLIRKIVECAHQRSTALEFLEQALVVDIEAERLGCGEKVRAVDKERNFVG